jgi:hypothetical protein
VAKRLNAGIKLVPDTLALLDQTAERLGLSRNATVEVMVRKCASHLQPISLDSDLLPPDHRGKRGQGRRKRRPAP